MNAVTITSKRKNSQSRSLNLKTRKISGTFEISSYHEQDNSQGNPADYLTCRNTTDNALVKIPVADYLLMTVVENASPTMQKESGVEEFPKTFTVVDSTPRLDRDGNEYYAAYAYKGADEFYEAIKEEDAEISELWADLVKSGKKDEGNYDPIQNYTISVEYAG